MTKKKFCVLFLFAWKWMMELQIEIIMILVSSAAKGLLVSSSSSITTTPLFRCTLLFSAFTFPVFLSSFSRIVIFRLWLKRSTQSKRERKGSWTSSSETIGFFSTKEDRVKWAMDDASLRWVLLILRKILSSIWPDFARAQLFYSTRLHRYLFCVSFNLSFSFLKHASPHDDCTTKTTSTNSCILFSF